MSGSRILDYLAFTITDCTSHNDIFDALPMDFAPMGYGMKRYKQGARGVGSTALVLWDGHADGMGVHVDLSSKALRDIERSPSFVDWPTFISSWQSRGARFSRLDFAIDDLGGSVAFERVHEQFTAGHVACVTRAGNCRYICSTVDGRKDQTLEVGSRQSERFMRCYQKWTAKGDHFDGLRFELEFKGKYADAAAAALVSDGWDALAGMMRAFIDFKDPDSQDSLKCRRESSRWWSELLDASKHRVNVALEVARSIERKFAHLEKQYAQTFFVLTEAMGGGIDWIYDLVRTGGQKLNRMNKDLLAVARANGGGCFAS